MIGSRTPFDDEAHRVVLGDRLRRLEQQVRRGKKADERKRITNTSGKMPCDDAGAAGAQGDRGADRRRTRSRERGDERDHDQRARRRRPRSGRRRSSPIARNQSAGEEPEHRRRRRAGRARSRSARSAPRQSRSMKPISMSSASAIAAAVAGQHRRLQHRPGEHEVEEAVHRREAGQVDGAAGAAGLDRQQQRREDDDRRQELRAAEGLRDRAPPERRDDPRMRDEPSTPARASTLVRPPRRSALCSSSPSRWWPVFSTKTSSRVGSHQLERLDRDARPRRARARPARCRAAPRSSSTSTRRRPSAAAARRTARGSSSAAAIEPSASCSSRCGWPISAFSDVGRALGDDPAAVDDPDVVGELVGLLQVLGGEEDGRALVVQRAHLLPDRLAADRVEAGGRLVEEEDARLVDERGGEVEPAPHAARVGADAAVGGLRRGRPARAARRRAGAPSRARAARAASPAAGSARGRSSAGRAPPPAGRRRSSARTAARLARRRRGRRRVALPPVGQQQRRQHPHRRRLAGPVRAEEGVDLALGDLEVDAGDGDDAALEAPLQIPHLDRGHGEAVYSRPGRAHVASRTHPGQFGQSAARSARFAHSAALAP